MNANAPFLVAAQNLTLRTIMARKLSSLRRLPAWLGMLLGLVLLGVSSTGAATSIWSDATLPANLAADDPNPVELGLKFRSAVNGHVTGIRFYKGPGNSGTHVGRVWTSGGVLLGSATFGAETASGWQEQALPTPVPISANTTYVVSYHAPEGQYAVDVGYFASGGVNSPPLRALADGEAGPNGIYAYGPSGTFPNQTFGAANYWVDVVFQETLEPDTTAPTITVVDPAAGATGVSVATVVSVKFSEPMNPATINNSTVQLRDAAANPVAGIVAYLESEFAAVLIPTSPLTVSQTYTVTVSGGATGVKDVAGNPLAANFSSSFTTGGQVLVSIWDDATIPGIGSANDPDPIEVGLKFQSAVNGAVTGIRFYKGPANPGPHVGNLWTATGTLLGSVVFANETATGWQTQALPTPVPIEANTTYVVSYHTSSGGYAVDVGYFAAGGVDNDPLRALGNGEAGGNGVYAYGASSTFPNQTFNAANYWVDVVVAVPTDTGCEGDITPPALVIPPNVTLVGSDCDTNPHNTGFASATDACTVTVTYSDAIQGTSPKVTKRTWTATDGAGNTVSAIQTITCVPPSLVTERSGHIFDRDPSTPAPDFRLLFIQDPQNWPCFRLVASNPGQFSYNVFFTGTPGTLATFNVAVPYPFVTKGAAPIHAYDGVTVVTKGTQQYLLPGRKFAVSPQQVQLADYGQPPSAFKTIPVTLTVPASGVVYLVVHLEYGFKGMSGFTKNVRDDAVDCSTGKSILIPNHGTYQFSVSGAQTGTATLHNENSFKRVPGVAGVVGRKETGNPVQGTIVVMKNALGIPVSMAITDQDGFYLLPFKHRGRESVYYVSIVTPPPGAHQETKSVKLKTNQSATVNFVVP
jgi:hypothetical protein